LTQHWLKEALRTQKSKELWEQIEAKRINDDYDGYEELWRELESILLKQEKEDNDNTNLSSSVKTYFNVQTDLKSLGVLD
jgi:hypothetical protein